MADWFVDASIAGGNGTDPASAFPSITSVTFAAGDRAWIRKTHYELVSGSAYIGPQSLGAVGGFSQWGHTIGWPSVGDPWYDERPARGVTVGWDSDVASTFVNSVMGLNMPTLAGSTGGTAQGFFLPKGGGVWNVCLQNNGTSQLEPWNNQNNAFMSWLDNVAVTVNCGGYCNGGKWAFKGVTRFGKLTMIHSHNGEGYSNAPNFSARHLVISSKSSIIAGGLFVPIVSAFAVEVVEIQTGSLAYLFDRNNTSNTPDTFGDPIAKIGRVTGVRPFTSAATLANEGFPSFAVEDYFGQGPLIGGTNNNLNTRVASINEAACDIGSGANNALICQVTSAKPTFSNDWRAWNQNAPVMRKYFAVTSGTNIQIRVPIYVDSTAVFSPTCGQLRGYMQAAGCFTNVCVKSTLLVGSPTKWTGSLIAAGSAWLWVNTFTPKETSTVPFDICLPPLFNVTSGTFYTGQMFIGEPYSV